MDDDFGDLYADLEDQVNAGIGFCNGGGGEKSSSASKDGDGRIGINDVGSDYKKSGELEGGRGNGDGLDGVAGEEDNGSDSEDDLQIVLNEEDCRKFPMLPRQLPPGGGDEDMDSDAMAAGGGNVTDDQIVDRKWGGDGAEQGRAERGSAKGGGYGLQSSQYKYIRSQSRESNCNAKQAGSKNVGYAIFSSYGKHEQDLNRTSQVTSPCSAAATTCKLVTPVIHNGFDFSLPKNRTIFDINIEAFERKPWRNNGVDIANFFNFDLNEESWKHYCKKLEDYRKQTILSTRNQVFGSVASARAFSMPMLGEHEEWITSGVVKPRGRAIQVEGGIRERMPSFDIRRSRNRDSDSVIQIKVEGSLGDSCTSDRGLEYADCVNALSDDQDFAGFTDSNMKSTMPSIDEGNQKTANSAEQGQQIQEPDINISNESHKEVQEESIEVCSDHSVEVASLPQSSSDHVLHNLSPSYLDGSSDASEDEKLLVKNCSPAKRSSLGSVTGFQDSASTDIYDPTHDRFQLDDDSGDNFSDCNIVEHDQKNSKANVQRVDLVKAVGVDGGKTITIHSQKKVRKNRNSLEKDIGKRATKHVKIHSGPANLSSESEREPPLGYKHRGYLKKNINQYSRTQLLTKKSARDHNCGSNPDRRGYSPDKRASSRSGYSRCIKHSYRERGHSYQERRVASSKDHIYSSSLKANADLREDRNSWLRRKSVDDCVIGMAFEHDDADRGKHREVFNYEMHGRGTVFHQDIGHFAYPRIMPHDSIEFEMQKKWDEASDFEMLNFRRYNEDEDDRKYNKYRLLASQTEGEHRPVDRRRSDLFSPRNHMSGFPELRGRGTTTFDGTKSRKLKNIEFLSDRREFGFCDHDYNALEGTIYPKKEDSYVRQQKHLSWDGDYVEGPQYPEEDRCDRWHKELDWYDDGPTSTHHEGTLYPIVDPHDDESVFQHHDLHPSMVSFPGRRSRFAANFGSYNVDNFGDFSDESYVDSFRSIIIARKGTAFKDRKNTDFGDRKLSAALKCEEAFNRHSDCWDRKLSRCHKRIRNKLQAAKPIRVDLSEEVHGSPSKIYDYAHLERLTDKRVRLHDLVAHSPEHKEGWLEKHPVLEDPEDSGLEEGQLVEEPEDQEICFVPKNMNSENGVNVTQSSYKEKEIHLKNLKSMKIIEGYDKTRIRETIAKMERRRERFKEPVATKIDPNPEKSQAPESNPSLETSELVKQRPARKRRWGGS